MVTLYRELTYPTWGPTEINAKLVVVTCHDFFRSCFTFGVPNFCPPPEGRYVFEAKSSFSSTQAGCLGCFWLEARGGRGKNWGLCLKEKVLIKSNVTVSTIGCMDVISRIIMQMYQQTCASLWNHCICLNMHGSIFLHVSFIYVTWIYPTPPSITHQ